MGTGPALFAGEPRLRGRGRHDMNSTTSLPVSPERRRGPTRAPGVRLALVAAGLALLVLPADALGQVQFVNASSGQSGTTTTSFSFSHTVNAGTDMILIVGAEIRASADSFTSVRYNGINLTKVSGITGASDVRAELWYLLSPSVGTFSVTLNASASRNLAGGAMTFTGVHQTTPLGTYAQTGGQSDSTSVTVSSAPGEMVVDVVAQRDPGTLETLTVGPLQTEQYRRDHTNTAMRIAGSTEPGASTVTMSWTFTGDPRHAQVAVPLKPAAQAPGPPPGCGSNSNVMLIVGNAASPSASDVSLRSYLQSQGLTVSYADDGDTRATYDSLIIANNIASVYISESVGSATLGTKAQTLNRGVVTANNGSWEDMLLGNPEGTEAGTTVSVVDNSHYITSPFALGVLTAYLASVNRARVQNPGAGATSLIVNPSNSANKELLVYLKNGGLYGGTPAAERRAGIYTDAVFAEWTSDTRTLVLRAIKWAAYQDACDPNMTLSKSVNPSGTQPPGTDLTYTATITNSGGGDAVTVVVVDTLPGQVDFKVGSVVSNLPVGVSVEYSNDGGSTWTYVPASGACGAPAGYDRCVNRIRWRLLSNLSAIPPNNTGTVEFVARIR